MQSEEKVCAKKYAGTRRSTVDPIYFEEFLFHFLTLSVMNNIVLGALDVR